MCVRECVILLRACTCEMLCAYTVKKCLVSLYGVAMTACVRARAYVHAHPYSHQHKHTYHFVNAIGRERPGEAAASSVVDMRQSRNGALINDRHVSKEDIIELSEHMYSCVAVYVRGACVYAFPCAGLCVY